MIDQALVIFSDNSGVWWLKGLKKGYRHCFVIAQIEERIVLIDPTLKSFSFSFIEDHSLVRLIQWYQERGMNVVHIVPDNIHNQNFNWAPFTCVEVIKRLLGIHNIFILTPWQLFKHLKEQKTKII